jgi:RpiB/LacA/LacB family sugar-phosphate isomerase
VIDDLGSHQGKTIAFGYDRHLTAELEAYREVLSRFGTVRPAVDAQRLHYLTSSERVCRELMHGWSGVGVLICSTGMGVCIAANKLSSVYAVRCLSEEDARAARVVNNANVLCLAVTSTLTVNRAIIETFMTTSYDGRKLDELVYLRRLEAIFAASGR